MQLRKPSKMN